MKIIPGKDKKGRREIEKRDVASTEVIFRGGLCLWGCWASKETGMQAWPRALFSVSPISGIQMHGNCSVRDAFLDGLCMHISLHIQLVRLACVEERRWEAVLSVVVGLHGNMSKLNFKILSNNIPRVIYCKVIFEICQLAIRIAFKLILIIINENVFFRIPNYFDFGFSIAQLN